MIALSKLLVFAGCAGQKFEWIWTPFENPFEYGIQGNNWRGSGCLWVEQTGIQAPALASRSGNLVEFELLVRRKNWW